MEMNKKAKKKYNRGKLLLILRRQQSGERRVTIEMISKMEEMRQHKNKKGRINKAVNRTFNNQ